MEDLDLVWLGSMIAFGVAVVWSVYLSRKMKKKRSTFNDDRDDTKNKYL